MVSMTRDLEVCAVSDIWSGLTFVRRVEDR